jgi:hypothetical protein
MMYVIFPLPLGVRPEHVQTELFFLALGYQVKQDGGRIYEPMRTPYDDREIRSDETEVQNFPAAQFAHRASRVAFWEMICL